MTTTPAPPAPPAGGLAVGTQRWRALWRSLRRPRRFAGRFLTRVGEDDLFTHAAALAYYFFFSLFPFVLFLLAVVTLLPSVRGIEDWLLEWAAAIIPGGAFATVEAVVRSLLDQPRRGLVSLGVGLALWSASTALTGITSSLNVAYGVPERRPWWKVRLIAIGMVLALSFFAILAFTLAVSSGPLSAWVAVALGPASGAALLVGHWLGALLAITLVIATIYHVCPDVDLPWRWFSPGSVLFTLGFAATSFGFSYYVTHFASYDKTYGSLGAVIILLLWLYFVAFLLLLGGEVNAHLDRIAPELIVAEAGAQSPSDDTDDDEDPDVPAWALDEMRRER